MDSSTTKSSVDIGILTIREDEFRAVLAVFPDAADPARIVARRHYNIRLANAGGGAVYRVAILRQLDQGNGEALDAARDLLEDLAPRLLLVVGIAGGVPRDDLTLGDVVLSTRVHDYSVEARKENEAPSYALSGGPIDKTLAAAIVNLPAREADLGPWAAALPPMPPADAGDDRLYGPDAWKARVRSSIAEHFGGGPRAPSYVSGTIATSDRLVKDVSLLIPWLETSRHLLAVEMESGGVYRAGRDRAAVLAIRGISDIVGLQRDGRWTKYACAVAAAFARAFLQTTPISVELRPAVTGGGAPAQAPERAPSSKGGAGRVRTFVTKGLTGKEHQVMMEALLDAFPSIDALRELVRVALGENLDALVGAGGLRAMIFQLIEQTESRGSTNDLLAAAVEARPRNTKLLAFAESRTLPASAAEAPAHVDKSAGGPQAGRSVTLASLRRLLQEVLTSASDFDAFCLDYFRATYKKFTNGMDRPSRTNLLLEQVAGADILAALRSADGGRFAVHEHLLRYEDDAST